MAPLADDLPVALGMSLAEARAALDAAQIGYELLDIGGAQLSFTHDGHPYQAHFDDSLQFLSVRHDVATLDEGLVIVRRKIACEGAPLRLSHDFQPRHPHEALSWGWPACQILMDRRGDARWRVRVIDGSIPGPERPVRSTMSASEIRELAAAARAHIDAAPPGEGERATAVSRWAEMLRAGADALDRAVEVAESIARGTPVWSAQAERLLEHARWLSRHDELFTDADDHRDALLVDSSVPFKIIGTGGSLGWTLQVCFETSTRRKVILALGPFVTGVCRMIQPFDELYPGPEEGPDDAVTISPLPPERHWKERVEATVGEVTVELVGRAHVERIARLLAVARAGQPHRS